MAKSAFESLNRKLEGEDPESNNIDITVVVEADADAAEDIIEAQEGGEASGEADSIAESEENSQEQAGDMEAMAAVLRQHGMTAGMHAACSVLLPLKDLGIVMRGHEELDAAGKNQADADRLAAALEAAADGFWASTKKFFADMWEKIKAVFRMISTTFGTMKGRVERARKSLVGRVYDTEAGKDVKFKDVNDKDFGTFTSKVEVLATGIKDLANTIQSVTGIQAVFGRDETDLLTVIGQKAKTEGNTIVGIEPIDKSSDYLKSEEFSASSELFTSYSANGTRAKGIDKVVATYNTVGQYGSNLKKNMKIIESNVSFDVKNTEKEDDKNSKKAALSAMRSQVAIFYQVISKVNGACKLVANGYIKGCAGCRRASKSV